MEKLLFLTLLLIAFIKIDAQVHEDLSDDKNIRSKLSLELIRTEPVPVIDSLNPDAREIPGGFEAGSTIKLTLNGNTSYFMISTTMETTGVNRWDHMRAELWISKDGDDWKRHRTLFHPHFDSETGLWLLTGSPFLFFDESEDRWYIYFNYMAFNGIRNWDTPCLLRRAGAIENGIGGITGEFEFPGEIVAPSAIAYPTDAEASSISPPFKAADGNWYAFLGGGPKPFNSTSGRWWVLIVKAPSPKGPFQYIPEFAPVPIMNPTGYVENPLPMKLTGPETGKEYWAIIFNNLEGEVTVGENSKIGFSSSSDGLTWSEQNVQIIDLREGLPDDRQEWWRAVRVPHQLVDEGNGIYTCFFSAYDKQGEFEGIGKATFRLREIVMDNAGNQQ
jgi:hypothetical protein